MRSQGKSRSRRAILCGPRASDQAEQARRTSGAIRILGRLLKGPATNVELARLALRYGARIKDLRDRGHDIPEPKQVSRGVFLYEVKG